MLEVPCRMKLTGWISQPHLEVITAGGRGIGRRRSKARLGYHLPHQHSREKLPSVQSCCFENLFCKSETSHSSYTLQSINESISGAGLFLRRQTTGLCSG